MAKKRRPNRKQSGERAAAARGSSGAGGSGGSGPGGSGPRPGRRRVRLALASLAIVVAAAGAAAFFALLGSPDGPDTTAVAARIPFPPPLAVAEAPRPSAEDFVGAESCGACHHEQYDAWRRSTHGRAGGAPGRDVVIARFDGRPIRFRDAVVTPSIDRRGDYVFTVSQEGRPEVVLRVDGVIGGGHMVGGGTQGFVSRFADGTLRFLPFDFARREGVWFCNTGTRTNEGWVPITTGMALADCGDWPPVRVLGDEPRFANCQQCHGSQITIALDSAVGRYRTGVASFAVNCESCHGPGREHVALARSGGIATAADIRIRSFATASTDESLGTCFQCHALKDRLAAGYLPGRSLEEHYALKFPILGDEPYHPDGRIRTFAYQEGHLSSACYLDGSMTCVDCHEPHGQGYRDVNHWPLADRFADGQCTGCHASKAEPVEAHTHHPAGSAGSRCVSCHMPYLQHPELGDRIRFARSDHVIPVPRPAFDAALGLESACAGCHTDRAPEQLQAQAGAWWGELKPVDPTVAGLIRGDSARDRREAARLLLHPEASRPMTQFAGLARFIERHLSADMPALEKEIDDALRRLAGSRDADLRALALAALHLARGEDPATRAFLAERLAGLRDDDAAVRSRWALALGYVADRSRTAGEPADAIVVYHKALEVRPRDPQILLNLGLAHRDAGDLPRAVERYLESLRIDPDQPLAYINLGSAFNALGEAADAEAAYRRALRLNPNEPLAHFNLGNLHLRRNRPADAIEFYEEAVELDPGLAQGHFYLGRSYILLGEYRKALDAVRRGLEFAPDDATGQAMLRDLERVMAGRE